MEDGAEGPEAVERFDGGGRTSEKSNEERFGDCLLLPNCETSGYSGALEKVENESNWSWDVLG